MDCPICNKKDLGANILKCPQCDSDLSSLVIIKNLRQSFSKSRYNFRIIIPLIVVLSLIGYFIYQSNDITIEQLKKENKILSDSLYSLNQKVISIKALTTKNEKLFITYTVKDQDNLWKLAKLFFNNGQQFNKIMDDNQLEHNLIYPGQKLKIYLE